MEPLNRPYRNREEANGESMIPVDRQPDDLRTRIAKALQGEADDGFTWEDWLPLADAVIAALGLKHYCRDCGGWGPMDD